MTWCWPNGLQKMPRRGDVFGPRKPYYVNGKAVTGGTHNGDDFTGLGIVRAIGPGRVVHVGRTPGWGAAGIEVVIDHGHGIFSRYWHLDTVYVQRGQTVDGGHALGPEGITGTVIGRHLHLQIHRGTWRLNADAITPSAFIRTKLAIVASGGGSPFIAKDDDMAYMVQREDVNKTFYHEPGYVARIVHDDVVKLLNYVGTPGGAGVNMVSRDDHRRLIEASGFDWNTVENLGAGQGLTRDGRVVNAGAATW